MKIEPENLDAYEEYINESFAYLKAVQLLQKTLKERGYTLDVDIVSVNSLECFNRSLKQ